MSTKENVILLGRLRDPHLRAVGANAREVFLKAGGPATAEGAIVLDATGKLLEVRFYLNQGALMLARVRLGPDYTPQEVKWS